MSKFRSRDYWIVQNLEYAEPSFRLFKCARMLNEFANGKESNLLDVGCGPGTLGSLLDPNIHYHGIDIAIHQPAPYLREFDISREKISFDKKRFDFVTAMGFFEYMGDKQKIKFEEIKAILNDGGKFIMSYINFSHYRKEVWPNYNNVQSIAEMKRSLNEVFHVDRFFPASHHWRQKQPGKYSLKTVQKHLNYNIPLISPSFAVEYFFICSHKK
jgi:cyclopropane fatty-acyl-phospholipid synthase-like methyltransferase